MSATREHLVPGPDHPITVTPFEGRVQVRLGEQTIADTTAALELREADHPPVMYVPLSDVNQDALVSSDSTSYCPYKGEAGYFDLQNPTADGEEPMKDAVWFYATPYPEVALIAGHVAFYPDKVQIIAEPIAQ